MPNRIIKESLCSSEKISSLTDFEFRLWIGLITQADDTGRGDARPAIIKGHIFPLRDRITVKDISGALHGLAAKGCISLYEIDGRSYFWFPSWAKHQRIRDAKPKFPAPPSEELSFQSGNSDLDQFAATRGNSRQLAANRGEPPQLAALIQSNTIQSNPNISALSVESEETEIELILNTGELYPVSKTKADRWRELYPSVDVSQELRNMAAWLENNPAKRKTKTGILRFCNGWLAREQDKRQGIAPTTQHKENESGSSTQEYVQPLPEMDEHRVLIDPEKPFDLMELLP